MQVPGPLVRARLIRLGCALLMLDIACGGDPIAPQVGNLLLSAGNSQSAIAGTNVAVPPAVLVTDNVGVPLSGKRVTFTVTSGGGSVLPAGTVTTDAAGIATATSWTLGPTVGANTLRASIAGLTVTFTATGTVGGEAKLAFESQPSRVAAGGIMAPVTVRIEDANGNLVSTSTTSVSVALGGVPVGTLGGATTVAAVAGRATFTTLSPDHLARGYVLAATATGLNAALSGSFDVLSAGPIVASPGNTSVEFFGAGADGNVAPALTISGGGTGFGTPAGVAISAAGRLYTVNFTGASVSIHNYGVSGNAAPSGTLTGALTTLNGPRGLTFDATGRLVVANGLGNSVTFYATGATGNTAPVVTITGGNTGLNGPVGVAFDATGQLYVLNNIGLSVRVFAAGASGNATPVATITGGATGLSDPLGIALDQTGRIYVANRSSHTITIYAAGASGNAAPTASITGAATGLNAPQGLAFDADGRLAVANSGNHSVTIYAAGATGNAAPVATIIGASTNLNAPVGVGF